MGFGFLLHSSPVHPWRKCYRSRHRKNSRRFTRPPSRTQGAPTVPIRHRIVPVRPPRPPPTMRIHSSTYPSIRTRYLSRFPSSQRDKIFQPGVARNELSQEHHSNSRSTLKGVESINPDIRQSTCPFSQPQTQRAESPTDNSPGQSEPARDAPGLRPLEFLALQGRSDPASIKFHYARVDNARPLSLNVMGATISRGWCLICQT